MLKLLTIVLIAVLFYISVIHCELISEYNDLNINDTNVELITDNVNTDGTLQSVVIDSLLNSKKLLTAQLELEEELKWHWYPWKRKLLDPEKITALNDEDDPCEEQSSIDDFPEDLFTNEQRLQGAIILHFLGAIYFFSYLGVVINNFFIPSVQCICDDLKISPDVGAAVFMSTATAMPELFTNVISTFIADSDMGLGTVIGSLMFNILGVAAISSLSTSRPVRMDWWPVTRDCFIFAINVIALVIFSWDGIIFWYEAMILLILIFVYYVVMFQNRRIGAFMKRKLEDEYRCCNRNNYDLDKPNEDGVQIDNMTANDKFKSTSEYRKKSVIEIKLEKIILEEQILKQEDELMSKTRNSLWSIPTGDAKIRIFWWFYSWPIRFILTFTTPNPKTWRKLYPLTFLMCIVWIAVIAYLIFWMLIIIGYTFGIPESVMGMTFLAIGGCTPEMITGVIMSRRGQAAVGVANSLGASSLAILLSLGLPWFIRGVVDKAAGYAPYTRLHSYGIEFTVLSLLGVVGSLYMCIALSNFFLKRTTGFCLIIFYLIFLTFAVLVEIDIFFPSYNYC